VAGRVIRVALIDDHPVVRDGTAALLAAQPNLDVAWTAGTLAEAATLLGSTPVDVVLVDIRLDGESGLRLLSGADHHADPSSRPAIIMLTAYDYPQYVEAAHRLGAAGFLVKTAPISALVDAISTVADGGRAFGTSPARGARLSPRELDVVRLVVDGRTNDEIGAALGIGTRTVETHLHRLFGRFALVSRAELASRATREGWLDL
jgi:DNA-binding NarL/FixJ family response regulator